MSLNLRTLRAAALCSIIGAIAGPAFAQQPASPPAKPAQMPASPPAAAQSSPKDPVVAIVNGQQIHLSDLQIAQQSLPQQYRSMPLSAVFPALLDRIVDSKLVELDARKNKVMDDPAFKKRMAFVVDQVIQDFWLQKEVERQITPEKMKARYEERLKAMPSEEEVHARHILVATEADANAVIAELKKGTPFDKLAKEKSTDKASGADGGDLGWFKKGDMVKEFADAAFALKKGERTETPVKTQFGYHVIELEDRRQAPPPSFDEMADQIREELAREDVTAMLRQLRANAKIETFEMDGSKPAAPSLAPAAPPVAPPAAPGK